MDGQNAVRFASQRFVAARPTPVRTPRPGLTCVGIRAAAGHVAEQVDVGPLERAWWATDVDRADHPGQPEAARLAAVAIVPDDVPAAPPRQHPPRLDRASFRIVLARLEVVESHDSGVPGRLEQRRQGRIAGVDVRQRARCIARRDIRAAGAQLDQRVAGRCTERRRLPQASGEADRGRLGRVERRSAAARSRAG